MKKCNDNGWIKIESAECIEKLPDSYSSYHGATENDFVYDTVFTKRNLLIKFLEGELTYYQKIEKPEPPLR